MLKKLQRHWGVNGWNLLLIITTFALGGSLCGYLGRRILLLTEFEKGPGWVFLYILLVTLLWPVSVLLVSLPLGQFSFFKRYIGKVFGRIRSKQPTLAKSTVTRIAIFASGTGTNAANIISYFKDNQSVKIGLIVCNNPAAGVISIAKMHGIELLMIDKNSLQDPGGCLAALQKRGISLIVLAGFLWKVPSLLIQAYPGKIINIHPALLPSYGGKGMYGKHVHEAVIRNQEKQSGITIHLADEEYDHGQVLFQAACHIGPSDSANTLAEKIHRLEQDHFPKVIEDFIKKQIPR
jgi:formyltetrahydrofolate-dependent phosphoribosylglycinamide formyltransferase